MALKDQLARWVPPALAKRFNLGQYPSFLEDYYSQVGYQGSLYPLGGLVQSALSWTKTEEISQTLPSYAMSISKSPPAFAAQAVRAYVLSQARLIWRNRADRHVFRNNDLRLLERPWINATTGKLLGRMEWNVGLAGNAYVVRQASRLRVLRPDWVAIVYGSQSEPDAPMGALDGEVVGYAYKNGGFSAGNKHEISVILPEEMAHWAPLPDPLSPELGMSWLTPALRELQADKAAEEYKLSFFSNGATPNLVVKGIPAVSKAQFDDLVDAMEAKHKGSLNAFKTLYLTAGADATVIGSNLQDLDLTSITSHSETRISYLSRVPAVILGIAAGLKGSSLNAGNYGEARRNFADSWYYSTLQDCCSALGSIVTVPGGAELWYDVADVPLLREDAKDAADIQQVLASTIVSLINGGYEPDSVVAAVVGQNMTLLKHSGLVSVQLQPPMPNGPPKPESPQSIAPASEPASNGSSPAKASRSLDEAAVQVTLQFPDHFITVPVNVEQPDIQIPVTVEAAQIRLEQPITVEAAPAPNVTNEFAAPNLTLEAPITVEQPEITVNVPEPARSKKVTVKRNKDGSSTATIQEED